jgi:hypothetical protein
MELRLSKPWQALTEENVARIPGQLGVFQVADSTGKVQHIGFAGARTLFGLRSALQAELAARPPGSLFRYEVNMQYRSRYRELLMLHLADHGELPALDRATAPVNLGRLH